MAARGQRFQFDLDEQTHELIEPRPMPKSGLIGDIKEHRATGAPSAPRLKENVTGFPQHKDRKRSQFKPQRASDGNHHGKTKAEPMKRQTDPGIDQENNQRLAAMSEEQIEESRKELMSSLNPAILEMMLRRANIEEDVQERTTAAYTSAPPNVDAQGMNMEIDETDEKQSPMASAEALGYQDASFDASPLRPPPDLHPVTSKEPLPPLPNMHFPRAPPPPELDPNDPDFLSKLHSIYFPALPSDPNALAWMAPIKDSEQASYSPSQESLPPSSLRFDFRGRLLPPRLSAQIPATKGLHHHGHAPESAGYSIPELAHLARSAVAAQRCISYQTLGRILYRLGRGDFGSEGEDLCDGLWELIEKGKVLQGMIAAAARESEGNRSVWATATDAVWLWRKGGGRRWKGR